MQNYKGVVLVLLVSCLTLPAFSADEARLGDVHFAISCKSEVWPQFDSAVALLHSFEFSEAELSFRKVESEDPKCVIAAWGTALAVTERNGANAPRKDLASGWTELHPWLAVKAGTAREQMYVDAVRAMYENYDTVSGKVRWQRYLARMADLRQKFPDDLNASLLYGLGLTWTAGPGLEGLSQRKKALAIFLPIFAKYPNNPGAAHYIIHAADTPELADEALPAARKYAAIAPDSPHALHMPSHIFNRVGDWIDSIHTNEASARTAEDWEKHGRAGLMDEFHALNNIEYAELQLGRDREAQQVVARIVEAAKTTTDPWLRIDARIYFDIETHDWKDGRAIEPPPGSSFAENFDAYWIETIASARLGDAASAERSLAQYRESAAAWDKEHGWGGILGVARSEAEAWTLFAEGRRDEAVAHLRSAEVFERDHPMYYPDILPRPPGEMLGDMLLAMHEPAGALQAYEESLKLAPNRFDSVIGAHKAALLAGNAELAVQYAQQLKDEGAESAAQR